MLPYDKEDRQQIQRKRHIGNGITKKYLDNCYNKDINYTYFYV